MVSTRIDLLETAKVEALALCVFSLRSALESDSICSSINYKLRFFIGFRLDPNEIPLQRKRLRFVCNCVLHRHALFSAVGKKLCRGTRAWTEIRPNPPI